MIKFLCADCGKRPPKFRVKKGNIKQDKGKHNLCAGCFRNLNNSLKAKKLESIETCLTK